MRQISMKIKRRAKSAPEEEREHDRQIRKLETRQEPDHSEQLQYDQDNENEEIKLFVLKHAAGAGLIERGREQPTGPQLNPEHVEYRTLRRQQQIVI